MKSKFKENGKNRILAVIASAVMFCLVVLLIIVTRKTDAVADTSVIINGKEYSQDNKMKILEIVSEDYYDELGPIIGNSSGSVKWDDIVAKATDKKVASNSDVQKNMDVYLEYVMVHFLIILDIFFVLNMKQKIINTNIMIEPIRRISGKIVKEQY